VCGGGASACPPPAAFTNVAASISAAPVEVCADSGPRPARAAGTPCMTNAECRAGTCCPPAAGETWGHCAGASGC